MKKLILLTVILLSIFMTQESFAQKSFVFTAGYTFSRLGQGASGQIIDRYNETRTWLDKKMSKTNPLGGYVFSAGIDRGDYSFNIAVNTRKSIRSASGTPPNGTFAERDLCITSYFWSFNGLWDFGSHWDKDYGLGINLGGAFGSGEYRTRVTGDTEYKQIMRYDGLGMFVGIFYEHYLVGDDEQGIGLRVTPYFRGFPGANTTDMSPLLSELDPVNANVPLDNRFNNHMTLGIMAELVFRLRK